MSYRQLAGLPLDYQRLSKREMGRPARKTDRGIARQRGHKHSRGATAGNKILLAIPAAEYRIIQPYLEPVQFHLQEILHEPTQKLKSVHFPYSGLISLVVTTEDGKGVEAGMVGNEGVAGVAAAVGLAISPLRHVVQVDGEGLRIETELLQSCLRTTPHLQLFLSRYGVLQGMVVAQTAACNRLHDIVERLARWLLTAADRVGPEGLPVTHEFLANTLGTHRPSVSVAAEELQTKGIIKYSRGTIQILNRRRLEVSACECYRAIQIFNGLLRLE